MIQLSNSGVFDEDNQVSFNSKEEGLVSKYDDLVILSLGLSDNSITNLVKLFGENIVVL